MSRLVELLMGWVLDVITFFDNLKPRHTDDPLTAEHRDRQRAVVWAVGLMLAATVLTFVVVSMFEGLGTSPFLQGVQDALRAPVGIVCSAALACSGLYAAYAVWALWRFQRQHFRD